MAPAPQPASGRAFWILLVSMLVIAAGLDAGLARADLRRVTPRADTNCDAPVVATAAAPPPSFMAFGSCGDEPAARTPSTHPKSK
jgi:hypothetical protein